MKISDKGKDLIKSFEGCKLSAYQCSAGVWTIGYGHTKGVKRGDKITQEEADRIFDEEIELFAEEVDILTEDCLLEQCQFDALVSFAYNVGIGAFRGSTLLRKVKRDSYDETIGKEFKKWVFAGGKRVKGLENRREIERRFYFGLI